MENRKTYILDTNVLLQDPESIFGFKENDVIIPAAVVEELDGKKRLQDELGRSARQASRLLDGLREKGFLHEGVPLPEGGTLRVELNHRDVAGFPEAFSTSGADNRILSVAFNLKRDEEERGVEAQPVIIVSNDVIVRIKADVLGIEAEEYRRDRVTEDQEHYMGFKEITVSAALIDCLYQDLVVDIEETGLKSSCWYPNEFAILKDEWGSSRSAVGQISPDGRKLDLISPATQPVWGVTPRNVQQKMALRLLLDDEVPLVTICGKAGTGKTLLTLASALHKTMDDQRYKKILVSKPVVPMGRDMGALPGELGEKLRPWMQPIYDNLEFLLGAKSDMMKDILEEYGTIQVEALSYIRGRSIPKQFIIIDEAQNLSKHEIKTIVSRVGEQSKIIVMGDPQQIDAPYLDERNNGLVYLVEKFKDQEIAGHVVLTKGERSRLAQLAADLL
ncbi:PhoH family protein [Heliobacterium chlorum]|uniref:PhoH family protein n=1 Tax=Heliobacterium chlorum TaxID=2698 RepID=A0ABR7T0G3_HELCL|nr:PhoH family protein [Heliobacterium chlorum]MBC9783458.1 PhoH family protein [Heliobacterium chlorum]